MLFQNAIGFFEVLGKQPSGGLLYDIDGNEYHSVIVGNQEWIVENLKTTHYADGTLIPNISNYDDWFLPSRAEFGAMMNNLHRYGVGGFVEGAIYWSSSEASGVNPATWSLTQTAHYPSTNGSSLKTEIHKVRACRSFISAVNYNLRDVGPAGGWIFYFINNWDGTFTYYEAAPSDCLDSIWSNITNVSIGTTEINLGAGQANTNAIINQVGHISSAAKLCDDIANGVSWVQDIEGAMCWYNNDISNKTPYGALYNWHAVDNTHGLVYFERDSVQESGWRIPTRTDLQTLSTNAGGDAVAGGALKEIGVNHWNTPNTGAVDSFGFKALGASFRGNGTGFFDAIKAWAFLWSSTASGVNAYIRLMTNGTDNFEEWTYGKKSGFSVRCVRDIT